jgi:hypothetical protein
VSFALGFLFLEGPVENRIPIPTDNVFKFYALFGLFLFSFGFSIVLYTIKSTNELMAASYVERAALGASKDLSPRDKARLEILERQVEVAKSDKQFFEWVAATVTAFGMAGMLVGFGRWHFTQRHLDEYARLQNEKLRSEIKALKRSARKR